MSQSRWTQNRCFVSASAAVWMTAGFAVGGHAFRIVDVESGQPVAARVYLLKDGAPYHPQGFVSYSRGRETHFLVPPEFELELTEGDWEMRVERGLEYHPVELAWRGAVPPLDEIRLRRWVNLNREGWWSADMHVHRAPDELERIVLAEDLNFVPTITTHVWGEDVNRRWPSIAEFPVEVEPGRIYTANSQEVERIEGGPGAVILFARDLPVSFDGYEMYPPSAVYTRRVRRMGGLVGGDKLFWLDTFVNVALGEIDFIEINNNHFLPHLVDMDLVHWSHWPVEFGYRAARGFALWNMDLYYRILNSGFRLPLSGGSASGVKATPVGFNRVYVRLSEGEFTYDAFMAGLKAGRTFSTNGAALELEADGRFGPGDEISARVGQVLPMRGRARSRIGLESLQLVVNGRVVAEVRTGGTEMALEHELEVGESCWVALRAFENSDLDSRFAHTSPIYVLVDGRPPRVEESIRDLLAKVDRLIHYVEESDGFRRECHRAETLDLYRRARAVYRERLEGR